MFESRVQMYVFQIDIYIYMCVYMYYYLGMCNVYNEKNDPYLIHKLKNTALFQYRRYFHQTWKYIYIFLYNVYSVKK